MTVRKGIPEWRVAFSKGQEQTGQNCSGNDRQSNFIKILEKNNYKNNLEEKKWSQMV